MKPTRKTLPSAADGWCDDYWTKHRHPSSGPILGDIDVSYAEGAAGGDPDGDNDDDGRSAGFAGGSTGSRSGAGSAGGGDSQAVSGSAGGGFVINVTYDQSQSALPAGFVAAVNYVIAYYESVFTAPVTVNIDIGYGEIDGQSLSSGALGESETYIDSASYSQTVAALEANDPAAVDQSAYSTLPANSPFTGDTLWMATAEEKALGLVSANDTAIDGYVGFSNSYPFSYSPTATPASGQYYFVGVVEHEFTEVMGRDSFLGDNVAGTTAYSVMDLFRYSAPGERDLTETPPVANTAYFSINNGNTDLDNWNTSPSGDLGDWASSAGNDAYLAFSPSGIINSVTPADLEAMGVLGWEPVISGAGSATTVGAGATVYVSSGQTSTGLEILSGGIVDVLSGGTAIETTVSSGGKLIVAGRDSGATVTLGGSEVVSTGGFDGGATITDGLQIVFGIAAGADVSGGGEQYVVSGGVASGTTVEDGGLEVVFGGIASATVSGGGDLYIEAGGSGSALTVDGLEVVFGFDSAARVAVGGEQYVVAGGTANGATLNDGLQVVFGTANNTAVSGGGEQYVGSGGTVSGTRLVSGFEVVLGTDLSATVSSATTQYVVGSAVGVRVLSGAYEVVEVGGIVSSATVSGGDQVDFGVTRATNVAATGGLEVVESGATASGSLVSNGGQEYVVSGGSAVAGTLIGSGGLEVLFGIDSGAALSGGTQFDFGLAAGDTALSGALQIVEAGGTASGSLVSNGGEAYVVAGGTATAATILSGASEVVYGVASGTTVGSGGYEFVEVGGVASGMTISGGVAVVLSGGTASGTITFSGAGELYLGDSVHFGGLVAGFGSASLNDTIDLGDVPFVSSGSSGATFVSWTQLTSGSTASGTLTVSQGGHAANVTLLGQYAAGNFTAANDGAGGTLITDPPVSSLALATPSG